MGVDPESGLPNYGFSMSDLDADSLGPFTVLGSTEVANYDGTDGIDESFDHGESTMVTTRGFRESWSFFPLPEPVKNGSQELMGLSYTRDSWRPALEEGAFEDEALHRETGYLLWDDDNRLAFRVIALPRGVTLLAVARDVSEDATEDLTEGLTEYWDVASTYLTFVADAASDDPLSGGILSNPVLSKSVRTVRFTSTMRIAIDGSKFAYKDMAEQDRADQADPHTDFNLLRRI